mgnify:FL=1
MNDTPPPYAEFGLAHLASARAVIDTLRDLGIAVTPDGENSIKNSLVSPIRAIIVRDEYSRGRRDGIKAEALLAALAARYSISYEAAYSITHDRR